MSSVGASEVLMAGSRCSWESNVSPSVRAIHQPAPNQLTQGRALRSWSQGGRYLPGLYQSWCCLWKFSPDRWLLAETWISQKFPPSVLGLSGSPTWLLPASTPMRLILAAWQLIRWPSLGDRRWQHTLYLSEIITNVSWWLLRIVCKRQFKPKECNCRTRTRSSVDDAGCSALQGVRPSCPLMRIPLAPCRPLSHCQLGSKPTRSETAAKTAYKGGNCEMWKCCKIQDQWIDETRSRQTLQPYGLRKQRRFTWNFLNQLCLKRIMKNEYVIAEKYDILSVTKRDKE